MSTMHCAARVTSTAKPSSASSVLRRLGTGPLPAAAARGSVPGPGPTISRPPGSPPPAHRSGTAPLPSGWTPAPPTWRGRHPGGWGRWGAGGGGGAGGGVGGGGVGGGGLGGGELGGGELVGGQGAGGRLGRGAGGGRA